MHEALEKASAANKVVKSLLQWAVTMYWRSAAAAHPFTVNKCSFCVLVGSFSAVKNQSIKRWHSCYIHNTNALIYTWIVHGWWTALLYTGNLGELFRLGNLGLRTRTEKFFYWRVWCSDVNSDVLIIVCICYLFTCWMSLCCFWVCNKMNTRCDGSWVTHQSKKGHSNG